jgi:hypothetical protein
VGRGSGQTETEAALELWQPVKRRDAHGDRPPPWLSDGWGGQREALVQVYGQIPASKGRGRRPTHQQPGSDWRYTQMVKRHDETGKLTGIKLRVIYGDETTPAQTGQRTVPVERTNLTSRHMNGRLVRKTLGFSKRVERLRAACAWEDVIYHRARPVKTRRIEVNHGQQRWWQPSPTRVAGLTDHIWSIREVLLLIPTPTNTI